MSDADRLAASADSLIRHALEALERLKAKESAPSE